ncbi:MAG: VRR-NUC domain-containing protein [Bdellovibrionales bacterium]|nr:VRR-NUC domain-containing protein [Bdellovibrionales bacterium]
MALPVLQAKYYLEHFFELIDFIGRNSSHLLRPQHTEFLTQFRGLSENAQCIYVRMVNRTGRIFGLSSFDRYDEVLDQAAAFKELRSNEFTNDLNSEHRKEVISFLTKPHLREWLQLCGITTSSSLAKKAIEELAFQRLDQLRIENLPRRDALIVQGKTPELDYLLFLYFGKLQKSLSLYALRDLGIRKAGGFKTEFRARFQNPQDAELEYRLLHLLDQSRQLDEHSAQQILTQAKSLNPRIDSSKRLMNQLLLEIANQMKTIAPELALIALKECGAHPARELHARLLFSEGQKDKSKFLLEQMIKAPWDDEELLFAEDFLARKFENKRTGYLSEALKDAKEVAISEAFFRKPEQGVRDYFQKQGLRTFFAENHLWLGLFGLLFWEELFESEASSLFNPFERSPTDLVGTQFYENHKISIEEKLELFRNPPELKRRLLKSATCHYGKLNDIFQWHPKLLETTLEFLELSKGKNLALILRAMTQRYAATHSGFPDLLVFREDGPHFIEVKAEGDTVRANQLSRMRLLKEAGFEVEILKVRWQADPNQIYTVVDIETTGGSANFHRITEIGALKIQNGKIIDEFQTLINPCRPIPRSITQITGITNEMVRNAPQFSEIAMRFQDFTRDTIFVAHFVRFDYGFIQSEFQRMNLQFVRPLLCTCAGMKKAYPGLPSYSLKNLTEHFHITMEQHHRALSDARAAAQLLLLMNAQRDSKEQGLDFRTKTMQIPL